MEKQQEFCVSVESFVDAYIKHFPNELEGFHPDEILEIVDEKTGELLLEARHPRYSGSIQKLREGLISDLTGYFEGITSNIRLRRVLYHDVEEIEDYPIIFSIDYDHRFNEDYDVLINPHEMRSSPLRPDYSCSEEEGEPVLQETRAMMLVWLKSCVEGEADKLLGTLDSGPMLNGVAVLEYLEMLENACSSDKDVSIKDTYMTQSVAIGNMNSESETVH